MGARRRPREGRGASGGRRDGGRGRGAAEGPAGGGGHGAWRPTRLGAAGGGDATRRVARAMVPQGQHGPPGWRLKIKLPC